MPKFGESSRSRLATCHPDIQKVMNEVIKHYDCSIITGHRNEEDQNRAVKEGKSKTSYPNSKHNSIPSRAVDVAPYPIDWADLSRFYYFAGIVMTVAKQMNVKLRWGGDWDKDQVFSDNKFNDLPHFELVD